MKNRFYLKITKVSGKIALLTLKKPILNGQKKEKEKKQLTIDFKMTEMEIGIGMVQLQEKPNQENLEL